MNAGRPRVPAGTVLSVGPVYAPGDASATVKARRSWPCVTHLSGASYRQAQLRFARLPALAVVRPTTALRLVGGGAEPVDALEVVTGYGLRVGFVPQQVASRLLLGDAVWFDARLQGVDQLHITAPRLDPGPEAAETMEVLSHSPRRRQARLARDRFAHDLGWLEDAVDDDGRPLEPVFADTGRLVGWQVSAAGQVLIRRYRP